MMIWEKDEHTDRDVLERAVYERIAEEARS